MAASAPGLDRRPPAPGGPGGGSTADGRQRATILFADITGYSLISERLGPEDAYSIVTRCLRLLDGIARRHAGAIDKYLGDCLMAVFGFPVAIEGAPLSAVRAALEMRQSVHELRRDLRIDVPLDVQIGINTGLIVAGEVGGTVIREFAVMGDPVNVAARLKDLAPAGEIYVGPETEAAVREEFELRLLPAVPLKGKRESIAIHRLVGALADVEPRVGSGALVYSRLVGRDAELKQLRQAITDLAPGRRRVVTLCGAAGLGKSRLAAELDSSPEAQGLRFLEVPVDRLVASEAKILHALEEGPLVLVLEDLYRAGPRGLDRLEAMLSRTEGLALACLLLLRPETPASQRVLRFVREHCADGHVEISLAPLGREDSRLLIRELETGQALSPESRNLVEERARGNPLEIILSVSLSSALRADAERAAAASRSPEAERRRTTVLFADIAGFTSMCEQMDPREAHRIVTSCLGVLDGIAHKHGGAVDKHLGDCVMATFGVPVAIENAPKAAINAALEMRKRVADFNRDEQLDRPLGLHIGIDTGIGIAGDVSGPLIREYALMGDSVNVASRLKDIAPLGRIYVGPQTRRHARNEFEFIERDPIRLKGREATVPTFELLSVDEKVHRAAIASRGPFSSELVGRDDELDRLRQCASALARGEGSIVSLSGEAGIGKSRLLSELAASEESRSVTWLEGRSLSIGRKLSFHPFADLLRRWSGIDDGDDDSGAYGKLGAAVSRLLPEEAGEVIPFVASLMGVQPSEEERQRLERIQGEAKEKLILSSTTQLLRRMAEERPLVLVFEDLHWADASSIELLESLLRLADTQPLLFLHVFRPHFEQTSGRVLELVRDRHAERSVEIRLEPLGKEACRRLIRNLFQAGDLPRETRVAIEEKAAGNPFFVEEVVRSLLDEGAVVLRDGVLRTTDKIRSVVIPGTVEEVIMARIDRLDAVRRDVLKVAAVIGGSFHYEVLSEVVRKDRIDEILESLVGAGMLMHREREYAFKHPLIHEVAHDSILEARRKELHLAIGGAIESKLTENLPGYHASLAFHFSRGGDLERAEDSLFKAGDEAAASAASNEALHFFREASRLYFQIHGEGGDPGRKATLEANIAQALSNRGRLLEAVEHYNLALEYLGEHVPRRSLEVALRLAPTLLSVLARLYRPQRRPPKATPRDHAVIQLMFARAHAQPTTDPTRFVFDGLDTIRRVQRVDPTSVEHAGAMYSGPVGPFSFGGVSFALSRKFLEAAVPLVPADDASELLSHRFFSFLHHLLEGDWSDAHGVDDGLLAEGLRLGQLWEVANYLDLDTERRLYRGEFAKVSERIERIAAIGDLYQYDLARASSQALSAYLLLEQRDLEDALEAADRYFDDHPEDSFHVLALGAKAKALVVLGRLEAADAVLEQCATVVRRSGSLLPFHLASYARSRLLRDVASLEQAGRTGGPKRGPASFRRARRSARQAVRVAAKVAARRPEVYKLVGHLAWVGGRHRRALVWWRRSLRAGEALGTRPEVARTRMEIGLRLASAPSGPGSLDGVSATEFLDQARAEFEALALEWDLEELAKRRETRH